MVANLLLGLTLLVFSAEPKWETVQAQFAQPPKAYSPVPIWWWSGEKLDFARLAWQMEQMVRGHVYNTVVLNLAPSGPLYGSDPDDPPFLSEEWWAVWAQVLSKARELGLHVWFYDQFGFSGAGLQSRLASQYPECRGQVLRCLTRDLTGPTTVEFPLPPEATVLATVAFPRLKVGPGQEEMENRPFTLPRLPGPLPAGRWRVMLFYAQPSGFDYLNPASVARLLNLVHGEFERRFPEHLGTTIPGTFQDELPGFNRWTARFPEEFQRRKGYDLLPLLPHLFADLGPRTTKVRADYFDVLAALAEESFFRPLFQWHERHGMICGIDQICRNADPLRGQALYHDYLRTMRWYGAPGNDQHGHAKPHSSLAHLYSRPRVWLEGFYNSGWGQTLEELANLIHRWYLQGSNLYNPHAWYYTTRGGWWEWAPPCTSFRQPYWAHYPLFADYVARLSYLLSQGVHVCHVAVLYPSTSIHAHTRLGAPPTPQAQAIRDSYWALLRAWEATGRDYDLIDEASVQRAEVTSARLRVSGEAYRVVILPRVTTVQRRTLEQLAAFAHRGGWVLALGTLPTGSMELGEGDLRVQELVREIFGFSATHLPPTLQEHSVGEGRGVFAPEVEPLVAWLTEHLPAEVTGPVQALHRRLTGREVYLVVGQPGQRTEVTFRVKGRPERWSALTGQRKPLPILRQGKATTTVALDFTESPACFVVFSPGKERVSLLRRPALRLQLRSHRPPSPLAPLLLTGQWRVSLQPTLDNRWGDFIWPPSEGFVPVECRVFRYRQETEGEDGLALGWQRPEGDVSTWERAVATFGPYWRLSPPDTASDLTSPPPFHLAQRWPCAVFSLKYGLEKDPIHRRTLGPKGHVPEEFLDLGTQPAGTRRWAVTRIVCPRDLEAVVRVGATGPKRLWVNGELVLEEQTHYAAQAPVRLRAGENEVSLQLVHPEGQRLRAFVQFTAPRPPAAQPQWIWAPDNPLVAYFRRAFELLELPGRAQVTLTADNGYELFVNGARLGQEEGFDTFFWQRAETYQVTAHLRPGPNVLAVRAVNLGGPAGLLVKLTAGTLTLFSDGTWKATARAPEGWTQPDFDDADWPAAVVLGPLGREPWGAIWGLSPPRMPTLPEVQWLEGEFDPGLLPLVYDVFPPEAKRVGWYRFSTAPGTQRLCLKVRGRVRAFVAGQELPVAGGTVRLPPDLQAESQVVVLRVEQERGRYGGAAFDAPVRFEVGEGRMPLGDWTQLGLPHYSGGVVYEREVALPAEYAGQDLVLDLGRVRGTAELWVNGQRVGVRLWSPYRFSLRGRMRRGRNHLRLLVYNTLGPHFGDGYPTPYVYPGQTVSGILGPVQIRSAQE